MTAITLRREEQQDILLFAKALSGSGFFREQNITTEAQAAIAIVAGREIGIGPVEAVRSFHFTGNGVQPSADLLARLVRRHDRYDYSVVELSDEACELIFFDAVDQTEHVSRFTMVDAKRAGLASAAWQKYPRNMLFARAMTNGVAWYAPDVIDAFSERAAAFEMGSADPSSVDPDLSPAPSMVTIAYGEGATASEETPEIESAAAANTPAAAALSPNVTAHLSAPDEPEGSAPVEPPAGGTDDVDAGAGPSGYREALWQELDEACKAKGKAPIAVVNSANKAHHKVTAQLEDFTAEELETAIEFVGGAA